MTSARDPETSESESKEAHTPDAPPGMLGVVAALAYVLGQGIAPALPGAGVGFGPWIDGAHHLAAVFTQLAALLLCVYGSRRLALLRFGKNRRAISLLTGASFLCAGAATMVAASGGIPLSPGWLCALSLVSAGGSVVAAIVAGRTPTLRAPALIVQTTAVAGGLYSLGRYWGALSGADADLEGYILARGISTGAWLLELLAYVLVALWVAARGRRTAAFAAATVLLGATSAALSNIESKSEPIVLLQRIAQQFSIAPAPIAPELLQALSGLVPLVLCILVAVGKRPSSELRLVVVLALISRARLDTPLGALMHISAALWLITSYFQGPAGAPPSHSLRNLG